MFSQNNSNLFVDFLKEKGSNLRKNANSYDDLLCSEYILMLLTQVATENFDKWKEETEGYPYFEYSSYCLKTISNYIKKVATLPGMYEDFSNVYKIQSTLIAEIEEEWYKK